MTGIGGFRRRPTAGGGMPRRSAQQGRKTGADGPAFFKQSDGAATILKNGGDVVERGIYFDGWYKNNHCYHPSLPFRSMQMVEDLEKYEGTMLVWSALGGGSISLPYLENEAFGEVDPRLRFYGFMNDSEFIAECNKRGIKVFGIVFEVQGWEFPVVLSEDGKYIRQMNVLRDKDQPHDWYGLREFSSGRLDGLFRTSLKDYYPDGIINSDGELVTDLWEEVAAAPIRGSRCTPAGSRWSATRRPATRPAATTPSGATI